MRIMRIKKKTLKKIFSQQEKYFLLSIHFYKIKILSKFFTNSNNLLNCYLVIRKYKNIQENK